MTRLNRRSRVISIRLSDEEFGQLQNLCDSRGIQSLSEIARSAMRLLVLQDAEPNKLEIATRLIEIQTRVSMLDEEIARISGLMGLERLDPEQGRIQESAKVQRQLVSPNRRTSEN